MLLSLLLVRPITARAYETDVHFYLTYVLARLAGFGDPEASLVARADQSMDDNRTTTAFAFPLPPLHYRRHGKLWHAFNANQTAVMDRFRELQCRAGVRTASDRGVLTTCETIESPETPNQLVDLGQFLHFFEDTYAHSNRNELTPNWSTYRPTFGHLFSGIRPDLVPNRPTLAQTMAWDVFCALRTFETDRGKTASSYPSRRQIDQLVIALALAYDDRTFQVAAQSGSAADVSRLPDSHSSRKSANLLSIRCALSAYLKANDLLPAPPDVRNVAFDKIVYDEDGNPQRLPAAIPPSRDDSISCPANVAD